MVTESGALVQTTFIKPDLDFEPATTSEFYHCAICNKTKKRIRLYSYRWNKVARFISRSKLVIFDNCNNTELKWNFRTTNIEVFLEIDLTKWVLSNQSITRMSSTYSKKFSFRWHISLFIIWKASFTQSWLYSIYKPSSFKHKTICSFKWDCIGRPLKWAFLTKPL